MNFQEFIPLDSLYAKFFWVTFFQWMLLAPVYTLCMGLVAERIRSRLYVLGAAFVVLSLVLLVLLFLPLLPLGLFPMPVRSQRTEFLWGVFLGGSISVPLKLWVEAWLRRRTRR